VAVVLLFIPVVIVAVDLLQRRMVPAVPERPCAPSLSTGTVRRRTGVLRVWVGAAALHSLFCSSGRLAGHIGGQEHVCPWLTSLQYILGRSRHREARR